MFTLCFVICCEYEAVVVVVVLQDAHSIVPDFDKGSSLFGVYDGHGGKSITLGHHHTCSCAGAIRLNCGEAKQWVSMVTVILFRAEVLTMQFVWQKCWQQ